jgi:S-adenosylmethionine hydrolase
LGRPLFPILTLKHLFPTPGRRAWHGRIAWVDRFGNAATNFEAALLDGRKNPCLFVGNKKISLFGHIFEDLPRGKPGWMINSQGYLEIAMREGSASDRLGLHLNQALTLKFDEKA